MKPKSQRLRFLTPAIIAATLALPPLSVWAEDPKLESVPGERSFLEGQERVEQADNQARTDTYSRSAMFGHVDRASDVIGQDVTDASNKDVAEIEDLVVDLESGRVVLAILEVGGIAGIGSEYYGVPPSTLGSSGIRRFTTDTARMKAAPKVDLAHWKQHLDYASLAGIYQAHGQEYYQGTDWDQSRSAPLREPAGSLNEDRQQVRDNENRELNPSDPDKTIVRTESRDNWGPAKGSAVRQPLGQGQGTLGVEAASILKLARASDLMDTDLVDSGGEKIGKIKDLGVDLSNGRLVTAIVSSGGFLGIGDQLRVLPANVIRVDEASESVRYVGTMDQFERAPQFSGNSWPIQNETYVGKVYRVFDVEPYFENAGALKKPDDTEPAPRKEE